MLASDAAAHTEVQFPKNLTKIAFLNMILVVKQGQIVKKTYENYKKYFCFQQNFILFFFDTLMFALKISYSILINIRANLVFSIILSDQDISFLHSF